jgi:small GTP-binding protein
MSSDIDLIKRLEREIGAKIEIRPDAGPDLKHPHGQARPKGTVPSSHELLYWFLDADDGYKNLAITSDEGRVVRLYLVDASIRKKIPPTLFQLKSIELLFIYGFNDSSIPTDIRSLEDLRMLFVGDNSKLRAIPPEIAQLSHLDETWFYKLKLSSPPQEIADQGIDAIRNYFASLEAAEDVDYLYEAKMVLVGRGFAGKTSLVRRLTIPEYELEEKIDSTEGIAIDTWDLKMPLEKSEQFRFNIWDFGGQEKYDATHQFFITERTVYLFVTEARQESNYLDFDYWLNIVQMLGNNSPVIVVQNKIDKRNKSLPTTKYSRQFPNIVAFANVSCAVGYEQTINQLRQYIQNAVRELPQVGDKLPAEWVHIRDDLAALNADHITYGEYCEICEKHGLSQEKAGFLSSYFHNLGVIVHHHDDPLLKKMVIVNPDWAVDGVYNVLDTRSIEDRHGRFDDGDLEKIWCEERYEDKRPELLALMKNYQICFELSGSGTYIAPELLAADPPTSYKKIKKAGRLTFIYHYAFMPAGLVSRLIVKLHHHLDGEAFWRHGVVAKFETARAVVIENDQTRQVRIDIEGDAEAKRNLLAIIRKEFAEIYNEFNRKIDYEERIPCHCELCRDRIEDDEEPHYFDWQTVQRYAREPLPAIRCDASLQEVSVPKLMGDITDKPDPLDEFGRGIANRDPDVQQLREKSEDGSPSQTEWAKIACLGGATAAIATILLGVMPASWWLPRTALVVGIAVAVLIFFRNPRTRYMRAFWAVLATLGTANFIPTLGIEATGPSFLVNFFSEGPGVAFNIVTGLIMVTLLVLDWKERR